MRKKFGEPRGPHTTEKMNPGLIRHYRLVQRPAGEFQSPAPVLVNDEEIIYAELCFAEQRLASLNANSKPGLLYEIEITQNRSTFDRDHKPLKASEQRGESDE